MHGMVGKLPLMEDADANSNPADRDLDLLTI